MFVMSQRLKKGYLQWRCRRGTKELDVVLNRFLDNCYEQLSDTELNDFNQLLDAQDTILWYWLIGKQSPPAENIKTIITKINAHD
jgi:antitoxin CptB